MIFKILILVATLASGFTVQAATHGEICNSNGYISEYICGGYPSGQGWYQGNDGCWYLNTNRPCHSQPNPPPNPVGMNINCESYNGRYTECRVPRGVRKATLVRQYSVERCVAYQTFGAKTDLIWVDRGCRGKFRVEYY